MMRAAKCHGKEKLTGDRARLVAKRMNKRRRREKVGVYKCEFCRSWHVGRLK